MSVPGRAGRTLVQVKPPSSERKKTLCPAAYAVFDAGGSATPIASPLAPATRVHVAPPSLLTSIPRWWPNTMVCSSVGETTRACRSGGRNALRRAEAFPAGVPAEVTADCWLVNSHQIAGAAMTTTANAHGHARPLETCWRRFVFRLTGTNLLRPVVESESAHVRVTRCYRPGVPGHLQIACGGDGKAKQVQSAPILH